MSIEEKMEADARSIYVGNVCTRAVIGIRVRCYLIGILTISRIGFGEWREGWEEVKGNGDQ